MCILFVYRGDEDGDSDYSLILATNRDEHYARPAMDAAFWEDDPTVIGGRDLEKGREGGTWLALSTSRARLGVLLSLAGSSKPDGKGRGHVVADYVSSDLPTEEYVKRLELDRQLYNNFNFVSIEIGKWSSRVHCYSNTDNKWREGCDRYLGYGNSLADVPFKKVVAGRERFERVCREWGKIATQDTLLEKLMEILQWDEKHLPDEELERRCPHWPHQAVSSVFMHMPAQRYGTRAQTLVLVRKSGQVEFMERSMDQPIDAASPTWHTTTLQSQL